MQYDSRYWFYNAIYYFFNKVSKITTSNKKMKKWKSQVTLFYIALLMKQIVSKQLYSVKYENSVSLM